MENKLEDLHSYIFEEKLKMMNKDSPVSIRTFDNAKVINTDNFEGNIKLEPSKVDWNEVLNNVKEKLNHALLEDERITIEDEEEMWKQIEKDYLVEPKESSIIKSTVLEKYINKLKEKELVYKECVNCDSGMILLDQAIQVLRELEAELTSQFLKTKI